MAEETKVAKETQPTEETPKADSYGRDAAIAAVEAIKKAAATEPEEKDGEEQENSPEPEQEEKPEVKTPAISGYLKDKALELGMTEEELKEFEASPKALEVALKRLEGASKKGQAEAPKTPAPVEEAKKQIAKILEGIDLSQYDEKDPSVQALTRLASKLEQIEEGLKKRDEEEHKTREAMARERYFQEFDAMVAASPHTDVLGKGTGNELDQKSEEFDRRIKLLETMDTLRAGFQAKNQKVSLKDLFETACLIVLKETKKQSDERPRISRPTSRVSTPANKKPESWQDEKARIAKEIRSEYGDLIQG